MKGFSKVLGAALLVTAVAAPSVAQAENNAQVCYAQLTDLDEARTTLDDLEGAVTTAKSDRSKLRVRDNELASEIPVAEGAERKALVAERKAVLADIKAIQDLLPAIESQAKALRADVDSAERAYIDCIQGTID